MFLSTLRTRHPVSGWFSYDLAADVEANGITPPQAGNAAKGAKKSRNRASLHGCCQMRMLTGLRIQLRTS